jgi:hypothetical protein
MAGLLFSQGRTQSAVRTRLTNSPLIPRKINAYKAVSLQPHHCKKYRPWRMATGGSF